MRSIIYVHTYRADRWGKNMVYRRQESQVLPYVLTSMIYTVAVFFTSTHLCTHIGYAQAILSAQSSPQDPLIIRSLQVSRVKPQGHPWDLQPRSAPDPYLKVYISGMLSWTSTVWRDTTHPVSSSSEFTISVYRRTWPLRADAVLMRIEVWDKDLASDDFITAFELSAPQLKKMTHTPLSLGTPSAHITLAWRSAFRSPPHTPEALPQLRRPPHIPQLSVVNNHTGTPPPKPEPLPCGAIPPGAEVNIVVKTPLAIEVIQKRGQQLIHKERERISKAQVAVTPCREGFDVHSLLKLGDGWIRFREGQVSVAIRRPKLLRKFPTAAQVKRRVIRALCHRILRHKSPQCPQR